MSTDGRQTSRDEGGVIGHRFVGLPAMEVPVGPTEWADPNVNILHGPEDDALLLSSRVGAGGAVDALLSNPAILFGDGIATSYKNALLWSARRQQCDNQPVEYRRAKTG